MENGDPGAGFGGREGGARKGGRGAKGERRGKRARCSHNISPPHYLTQCDLGRPGSRRAREDALPLLGFPGMYWRKEWMGQKGGVEDWAIYIRSTMASYAP